MRDHDTFEKQYQEHCDRLYWKYGPCCAGCDHWGSDSGNTGTCAAAGVVSGADVMRSITNGGFSSYTPPPGLPYTKAQDHCGKFRDQFDWSTLDQEYLARIGATRSDPGTPV